MLLMMNLKTLMNIFFPCAKNKTYDVMISGYYGFDNSGDDSILKAIVNNLKELKPDIKILALSNNPKQTKAVYGVDSIHRFNFPKIYLKLKNTSLLISGGGSLIQDITSDKSFGILSHYNKTCPKNAAQKLCCILME